MRDFNNSFNTSVLNDAYEYLGSFLNDDIAIIETEQDGGNANKIVLIDKKWKWGIKREK